MKNLLVFAFAGVLFYGCSNSKPKAEATDQPQQSLIEITNDMENASAVIPSWINEKTVFLLKEPAAHSGEFSIGVVLINVCSSSSDSASPLCPEPVLILYFALSRFCVEKG